MASDAILADINEALSLIGHCLLMDQVEKLRSQYISRQAMIDKIYEGDYRSPDEKEAARDKAVSELEEQIGEPLDFYDQILDYWRQKIAAQIEYRKEETEEEKEDDIPF